MDHAAQMVGTEAPPKKAAPPETQAEAEEPDAASCDYCGGPASAAVYWGEEGGGG
jgi:hypothetical protein